MKNLPFIFSFLILIAFLFVYAYGFNSHYVNLTAKFDNLAYVMQNEAYDKAFHAVVDIKDNVEYSVYRDLQFRTSQTKRVERIESYILAGDAQEDRTFALDIVGFDNLSFDARGITSHYYGDGKYKFGYMNLEIHRETSDRNKNPTFFLPSSIADEIIRQDQSGVYNSYDDIIDYLRVNISTSGVTKTPLAKDVQIRNVFFDEYTSEEYQGKDGWFGESLKKFIGPYFLTSIQEIYNYADIHFGFTTRSSFYSLKNYLKEYFYENNNFNDAAIKIYGNKGGETQIVFEEESINALFSPKPFSTLSNFMLLMGILIIVFVLIAAAYGFRLTLQKDADLFRNKHNRKTFLKYAVGVLAPFLLIHSLYAVFLNRSHSISVLKTYNIVGNTFTLITLVLYFGIIGVVLYIEKKRLNNRE